MSMTKYAFVKIYLYIQNEAEAKEMINLQSNANYTTKLIFKILYEIISEFCDIKF